VKRKSKSKSFTIMIIPHSEKTILSFKLPLCLFQIMGLFIVGLIVTSLVFTNSYQRLKAEVVTLRRKNQEFRTLKEQIDYFAKETAILQEKLKNLEKLDADLRDLMKNDPAIKKIEKESYLFTVAQVSRGGGIGGQSLKDRMVSNLQQIKQEMELREESLESLKSGMEERHARLAATPSIWPIKNPRITSRFGWRKSPYSWRREFHHGIDMVSYYGAPVYATCDGIVRFSGWKQGYGRTIIVSNKYGFTVLYGHNARNLVKTGDKVKKGDVIARLGNSGRSTGPHLHYEIRVNGIAVDPRNYLH